jgi:nucleotide-binding universal stress UspA family protein
VYVRVIRVMDLRAGSAPTLETDAEALEALGTTAVLAREAGVPFVPIYVASPEIAEEILDFTVTYGCDTLIMGKSKRSVFSRTVSGDVVTQVAQHLPDDVALITRSADTPHVSRPAKL